MKISCASSSATAGLLQQSAFERAGLRAPMTGTLWKKSRRMMGPSSRPIVGPLVSVLVPCHNGELYLAECLESALAQLHRPIEIIFVDDGSTDGSLATARAYESRGVRVLTRVNGGQLAALNTALAAVSGKYIQFLDSDDVLDPGKISAQVALLENADPAAIASGAWARFGAKISEAAFMAEPVLEGSLRSTG